MPADRIIYFQNGSIKYDPAQPFAIRFPGVIDRVDKPELNGAFWRTRCHGTGVPSGSYLHFPREKQEQAWAFWQSFKDKQEQSKERGVVETVREYLAHIQVYGGEDGEPVKTWENKRSHLEGILQLTSPEWRKRMKGKPRPPEDQIEFFDRPLRSITPEVAASLYSARVDWDAIREKRKHSKPGTVSPATHHSELIYAKAFFNWCVEKKYLEENPFEKVKRAGKANRGKATLGIDQAQRFLDVAFSYPHPFHGKAAAACLILNMRPNETATRRACDLDGNGTVMKVRPYPMNQFGIEADLKTLDSERDLDIEVPEIQAMMLELADLARRGLLGSHNNEHGWEARLFPMHVNTLRKIVKRICKAADCPDTITTQGLRGSGAKTAVRTGFPAHMVSSALGHAHKAGQVSPVTAHHYVGDSALAEAKALLKQRMLLGSRKPKTPTESLKLGTKTDNASLARPNLTLVR